MPWNGSVCLSSEDAQEEAWVREDLISVENNERSNDGVKEGQCKLLHNICCTSPLQHIESQPWLILTVFTNRKQAC
jgi:hypothetical protein